MQGVWMVGAIPLDIDNLKSIGTQTGLCSLFPPCIFLPPSSPLPAALTRSHKNTFPQEGDLEGQQREQ